MKSESEIVSDYAFTKALASSLNLELSAIGKHLFIWRNGMEVFTGETVRECGSFLQGVQKARGWNEKPS